MGKGSNTGGKIQWSKMLKKLSPYTIQKGFRYLKHYGVKEFFTRGLSRRRFLMNPGMKRMYQMRKL